MFSEVQATGCLLCKSLIREFWYLYLRLNCEGPQRNGVKVGQRQAEIWALFVYKCVPNKNQGRWCRHFFLVVSSFHLTKVYVVVRVLVQLVLISDLLASMFSSPGCYRTRYGQVHTFALVFEFCLCKHRNLLYTVVGNRLLVIKILPGLFT